MDKPTEIVDYAYPAMQAEKALRALHEAALEEDWHRALDSAIMTIRWVTEAHAALKVMQQKDR